MLDLSEENMERIMRHVAEQTLRTREVFAPPPTEILELAMTNKKLRVVASKLTEDSIRWSNEILVQDLHPEALICPHLSMDIDSPFSSPTINECTEGQCRIIHAFISWFKFAIPNMKSLDFSLIWKSLPLREAYYLIHSLSRADTKLRKMIIETLWNDPTQNEIVCDSLNMILDGNATSLHSLHVRLCGPVLWNELQSHSFQSLKKLYIQLYTTDVSWNMEGVLSFIGHCSSSVEHLNKLKLFFGEDCFLKLHRIQEACPNMKRLHIIVTPSKTGLIRFPTLAELMLLSIPALCIEEWDPKEDDDHFEIFAHYVAKNRNVQRIEFKNCTLPTLALELEKHGHELGEKIRRLSETTCTKPKRCLMKQVELFCCKIERLWVHIEGEDMEHIRRFLVKSSTISEIFIGVVDDYKILTDDLIRIIGGLEVCPGTITSFSMFGVSTSPEVLCNLLDAFDEKLSSFCLWLCNELDPSHFAGVNKVLKHLLENEKFQNLMELCIELRIPDNSGAEAAGNNLENEEQEMALRTECRELVKKLEKHCQGLDSELLRTRLKLDIL